MKRNFPLMIVALAALQGCATPLEPAREFWASHTSNLGLEADLPDSLTGLGAKSDLVALGRIVGYAEGRDYTDPGRAPNRTGNVVIEIITSRPAKVTSSGRVRVEFTRDPLVTAGEASAHLPTEDLVFFLSEFYDDAEGHVYRCASPALCVLGVDEGEPSSKRDSTATAQLQFNRAQGSYNTVEDIFTEATT